TVGRMTPYGIAGGGVVARSGDLPVETLTGSIQFQFLGTAPFSQTDVVTLHYTEKSHALVGMFGGGGTFALSARFGIRGDVRVYLTGNSLDTLADAQPNTATRTPSFFASSATTPSLVFSNSPATRANLTGPAISSLKTFAASGTRVQTSLTV